jgi:hypothetical protein
MNASDSAGSPIRGMTGFGAAEGETPFGRTAIEIRSV